jgi:RNA polymerase sigma-70 factor (ECF subfamily)
MTGEAPDELLMTAYANGDDRAFEHLFERHRRPLYTYLLSETRSRARTDDLFQEVFLRVIRGRQRFDASGSFRAWLFTIARNALTDARRRAALRDAEDFEERTEEGSLASGGGSTASGTDPADPVAWSHARDLAERIESALRGIPADQREVFLLRERGGLDFKTIAATCGCGLATAKSRMRYALENLRRRLADELPSIKECLHE